MARMSGKQAMDLGLDDFALSSRRLEREDWLGAPMAMSGRIEPLFGASALAARGGPGLPSLAADFPAALDLASLDGSNGFRIDGIAERDYSGFVVSSAGDVNGDGFDDIIIGAKFADPNGDSYAGESYVVFGKAGGFDASFDLAALDGANGFRLDGIDVYNESGASVSSAGDINGDGFDDIIIGAPSADYNYRGESYVVFGKAGGFAAGIDLAMLDGSNGFSLEAIGNSDSSGASVSSAGDVNGDGFDDILIGARNANNYQGIDGEAYVVFGHDGGFVASFELASLDGSNGFRLVGDEDDVAGVSVSSVGDINNDGFDDVVIGTGRFAGEQAGASYVVFGRSGEFGASIDLAALDGSDGFRIDGIDVGDYSGRSVSSASDVNGDGFDDILIGASGGDPGGDSNAGESYVVFGQSAGFAASIDLASLDGSNGFRLDGLDSNDGAGRSVSGAGDVNGDGFGDIIIGARGADPEGKDRAGESYVVFGHAGGFSASFDLASLDGSNGFRVDGIDPVDYSGSVSSAGDVNGDGFDDIIIGAFGGDPGGDIRAGESYVIFGRAPTEAVNRAGSAADQAVRGGDLNDTLRGLAGDDTLGGGDGGDALNGGGGRDWADYSPGGKVRADLGKPSTSTRDASGDSYVSIENLRGSGFRDDLFGDDRANRLEGLADNDLLNGRAGDDTLAGGAGRDQLRGSSGADRFELASLDRDDADTILDFVSGEDRIALDGDVFGLTRVKASQFVTGNAAGDANDRLIYNADTGKLFFDPDGTGAQAQLLIAILNGAPTLSATDFTVI